MSPSGGGGDPDYTLLWSLRPRAGGVLRHRRTYAGGDAGHPRGATSPQKQVDPRGLEPLASAIRGRRESFAVARYRSKNRSNTPNPWIVPPQMFAAVRAGCRQTVVNCRRACTEWASVLLVHFISCGKPACPYFFPSSDPVVPIIAVRFVWSSLAQFVVNPVCEYLS